MERLGELERRCDTKVVVEVPVVLEMTGDDENQIHISSAIKNISAGGIGFESGEELKEGCLFSFLLDTNFGCVRLRGCILWRRKVPGENERHVYQYGGHFLDLTSHQEAVQEKFLLHKQVKVKKCSICF